MLTPPSRRPVARAWLAATFLIPRVCCWSRGKSFLIDGAPRDDADGRRPSLRCIDEMIADEEGAARRLQHV